MTSFFSRPFPYIEETKNKFFTAAGISIMVLLFLYIFQPYGIRNMNLDPLLMAGGYGMVSFIVSMLTSLLLPRLFPDFFNEDSWMVWKEIIYIQVLILMVATVNLLYTYLLGYCDLDLIIFFTFEGFTLAVTFLPITLLIITKQFILNRKTLQAAQYLSKNLYLKERLLSKTGETVTIQAKNPKDNLVIEAYRIYYITTTGKELEVYFASGEQVIKKTIPSTLRTAQTNIKIFSQFYRCHRAYIVNLEKVKRVTGNAQGYRLILENINEPIPVSRSMDKEITMRLSR